MPTIISGDTGVNQIQDGVVSTAKLAANAVTPAKTQAGALPSMVRLNTANGYGSTNTKIRRFTNQVVNQGADITYADSSTLGASFTINTAGVYAISYADDFSSPAWCAVSINTTAPTTSVDFIPATEILTIGVGNNSTSSSGFCSWVGYLPAGSVLRPHTSGVGVGGSPNTVQFTITRVA